MPDDLATTTPENVRADTLARVVAVQESLATIEAGWLDGARRPLKKNEVVLILSRRAAPDGRQERLKAEVLRVCGELADVQVFEDTRGIAIGDPVEQTSVMLSVILGPGLLGQVYDGLQSPLDKIALQHGVFLPHGVDIPPLDRERKWSFVPAVQQGARLCAGGLLGTVAEGRFTHKIMVPFDQQGEVEVTWIQEGTLTLDTPVARLRDRQGQERSVDLRQRWPVRRPLTERETSGRLEEIPGQEAFPAYLESAIRGVYERAGLIRAVDGSIGSLTMIGTVSPAGGNFEEPVTQGTLSTVKSFLGLSYDRAYRRFYPAIDPLISWSRYLDQLAEWYACHLDPAWTERVKALKDLLVRGDGVQQMMQVTGEEGASPPRIM